MTDVFVVGAGPAGALAAAEAARLGLSVRLAGDGGGPARIESITSAGLRLLADLRLGDALAGAAVARVARIELDWRAKPESRAMGVDAPVLLMRPRLERLLAEVAVRHGARRDPLARVRRIEPDGRVALDTGETVTAGVIIDAAGRRAGLRPRPRLLGPRNAAIGFRGKAGIGPAEMKLTAHPDGWLWTAHPGDGRLHGVWLGDPSSLAGLDLAGRRLFLAARCGELAPEPSFVAEAGLTAAETPIEDRIIRIGDAALARDPISSHGLAWALGSAARAAVAAATMLDGAGADDAVRSFLARDHAKAVEHASAAVAAAYADQARYPDTVFWRARAERAGARQGQRAERTLPVPQMPLALSPDAALSRVAALEGDRIRWREGMTRPARGEPSAFIAGCPAAALHSALSEPGPPAELARRIDRLIPGPGPRPAGAVVIESLWRDGVLVLAGAGDSTGL